ncbi:MAG: glycine--tRNA ligase [Candidatus Blackburnbacteria bacterium]|nr:glycine--tRNA ligase [Candidatus Blackburnbacteria bacterium]
MKNLLMEKVVSLCKRRGFVFPGSLIYGGLANTWDYGPLGTCLLQNIRSLWWERFVTKRDDIYPLETGIIMNPRVWQASGHTASFTDPLVECKVCHQRFRADHEVPESGDHKHDLTEPRSFNLMFETHIGPVEDTSNAAYLRPETAQGMFVNFKNVLTTERPSLPFGIAQIGKAFRNEITPGNFIFRTLEFEQMEIEYFVHPEHWEEAFESWKESMWKWLLDLGVKEENLKWRAHAKDELSHYSKRTEDIEYEFPFGWGELYGLAYRADFDLRNHSEKSSEDLMFTDPATNAKFFPHVVEPTFGVNRTALTLLLDAYTEEGDRVVLKLNPKVAPYKVAVFPLVANREEIVGKAREIYNGFRLRLSTVWDNRGNIGKRYYAQDEIGTPWCVTVDYQTLEDKTVTVRDRDSAEQIRVKIDKLLEWFSEKLK